jgi:hypothetical protein
MVRNYASGKIYSIRSHQTNEIYIGSTITTLSRRLRGHHEDLKKKNDGNLTNCSSFTLLAYPDHYIELIESYPCANKNELVRREGQIIRDTINCVNKNIAGRTISEYYQDNKVEINATHRQHYQDTLEHTKAKHIEWALNNKDKQRQKTNCYCGGSYSHENKAVHFKTQIHKDFEEEFKRVFEDSDSE